MFLVKGACRRRERLEVYLPGAPQREHRLGRRGRRAASRGVPYRIEVGISEHRIRVFRDDEVILDEPVGVGRTDRPTPGGVYYLKELLQPPDPNGPYGTYAYGLSGLLQRARRASTAAPGVIGIHGTNEPDTVGTDVSSGCIRLHNDVIERLVEEIGLPLGTPVEILA